VRDKLVDVPEKYRWSSYKEYVGGKTIYVDRTDVDVYLTGGRQGYRRFVLEGVGKEQDPLADVYAGFLLGSPDFIKDQLRHMGNQIKSVEVSHRQELRRDDQMEQAIISAVAKQFKIPSQDLFASKSRPMRAKQVAIYLLRRHTSLTNREIGEMFGIGHSAVSKAGLYIEQLVAADKGLRRKVAQIISNFEV
jgi:hypothetical protein